MKNFIFCAALCFWPSAVMAKMILKGEAIQGGIMIGIVDASIVDSGIAADVKVFLDGVQIPVLPSGEFIIGFGRDHTPSARLELMTSQEKKQSWTLSVKQRQYDVQHISGLPEEVITPPPRAWPQIRREAGEKRKARLKTYPLKSFASQFVWPATGRITGVYGSQRILNGKPRRPHYGIDIAAGEKREIIAPADGIVTLAGAGFYFEGGLIFLDHGMDLSSAFLHLEKILVRAGQKVRQGEVIGLAGATGRSTGVHLDWRIKWRRQNLDPALIVAGAADGAADCAPGAFVVRAQAICDAAKANDPASP